MENITAYLENIKFVAIVVAIVVLMGIYFLRNPIKAIFSGFFGYKASLDDFAISVNKNKDIIYENELVLLRTGINFKNALLLIASILSVLVHPFIFVAVFFQYKYNSIKEKISKLKDYSIYDDMKDNKDIFVNFLNFKSAKINFFTNELMYSSYILIVVGLFLNNLVIAITGLVILTLIQIVTAIFLYNAFMYRINYKYVEFYRVMRLLNDSSLGANKSLIFLGLISFYSNFTNLAGFSIFCMAVFLIKAFISLSIYYILKREDFTNEKHQMIENRDYTNLENIASYPNLISQSRGYKFTTALQMKFLEIEKKEKGKNIIHFDNYAYYPQSINKTNLRKNPLLKKTLSNTVKNYFEAYDITKQLLVIGGMGSGKTEMINYIIEQVITSEFKLYNAIVYNDIKGDFSKNFYREDKDILVNLYDIRASVWCPFLEMKTNIEAGSSFINNLFESISGKEKDFFNASAKMKTSTWIQESFFSTNNNIEAWEMFFKKIKNYENEIKLTDDKTQSSIYATIEIALDILYIMHYQIVVEKRKTFTFYDLVRKNDIQLFFVNAKQYETKLTPYLTGLTATYINTVMSKEDIKDHLILNVFDEFLTMKIDESTRTTLLTATRSKGFSNILMSQFLIKDEKLLQELDSSKYALITFSINDPFTLNSSTEKFGEAEHLNISSSPAGNNSSNKNLGDNSLAGGENLSLGFLGDMVSAFGKKDKLSYSLGNTKVLVNQQLQSMPLFHHLTFIPLEEVKVFNSFDAKRFFKLMVFGYDKLMGNITKENDFLAKENGVLYLGYTPQSTFSLNNEPFISWDMKNYYLFKLNKQELKKDDLITSFDDEKEEFKHYMNIKFAGTVEAAKDYIRQNNLERYDIDNMFKNVEENNDKVQKLLSKYSEQQRYDLMEDFFKIDETDLESKYNFCKENDLIGCILGIFTFSKEFRETVLGEFEDDK